MGMIRVVVCGVIVVFYKMVVARKNAQVSLIVVMIVGVTVSMFCVVMCVIAMVMGLRQISGFRCVAWGHDSMNLG